jgi:hypothetical protein
MSDSFISNTHAFDKLVAEATSKATNIGDAYEQMKAELRGAMGIVNPASENEVLYGRSAMPAPVVAAPDPTVARHAYRVIYPFGNMRVELYGTSEEDLDSQEQKIRSLYQ